MADRRRGQDSFKDWDYPPNSRLFIVCSKSATESEFKDAFDKYGDIEDIWIVKDKNTGESKGVVYIKFAKTSQAALAMEEMNGCTLPSHLKPLKVLIAHNRQDGSRRDANEEKRLLRLFVILPKTHKEADVVDHFEQFGDIDYVSIIKDKTTGDSKGYGYVTYRKVSQAAKAFELCDRMYKAVFAEPKPSGKPAPQPMQPSLNNNMYDMMGNIGQLNPSGCQMLQILPHPSTRQSHLARLCDLIPGMDYCDITRDGTAIVKYFSPQSAAWAKEKLNGIEYPPGYKLLACFYDGRGSFEKSRNSDVHQRQYSPPPLGSSGNVNPSLGELQSNLANLATIAQTLAQTTSLIQKAALVDKSSRNSLDTNNPSYCSVRLPSPRPPAPLGAQAEERLFIVCTNPPAPEYAIQDCLSRFGSLIDFSYLLGKNYGYAKFASRDAALDAVDTLHNEYICGQQVRVMIADPYNEGERGRKRLRIENSE